MYLWRLIETGNLILNCEIYTIVREVYTADSIEMNNWITCLPKSKLFTVVFTYLHR